MNASGVESGHDPGGLPAPHDAEPVQPRGHRRGMLAGLGVVGLVLAGLLLFSPGGTGPRPAAQDQTRSPVTIPVQSLTTMSTTTTSAPPPPTPTPRTGPVTDLAASTYEAHASAPARGATTTTSVHQPSATVPRALAPATTTTTTTAVAPPPTTTTTAPPVTTTTSCILVLCD